jgi:signal transduction histidine kinase
VRRELNLFYDPPDFKPKISPAVSALFRVGFTGYCGLQRNFRFFIWLGISFTDNAAIIKSEELAVANAQLREYTLRIEELATVQERNRIARDIHDSVGHALTVLNLHLEAALKLWQTDPESATEFLTEAKQLGSHALKEVRQSISTLRVDPLVGLSLPDAIADLVEDVTG